MTDLRKAAEMALEVLESLDVGDTYKTHNAASALRQALAEYANYTTSVVESKVPIQPEQEPFNRLIRIMGTFDLATGHADSWDELLDSLESELRDVLGYHREALRQALAQPEQEPVAWMDDNGFSQPLKEPPYYIPLYIAPPKRKWVGLTDDDFNVKQVGEFDVVKFARYIEAILKERNCGTS